MLTVLLGVMPHFRGKTESRTIALGADIFFPQKGTQVIFGFQVCLGF